MKRLRLHRGVQDPVLERLGFEEHRGADVLAVLRLVVLALQLLLNGELSVSKCFVVFRRNHIYIANR